MPISMPMIMLMPRRMTMTWASEEHSGRSPNPRRDESSRIESSRALKRLSRPQVKQTIKACKRENKGKMRIRMKSGEGGMENGESISMKEMQLGAKEWSRSGSQVGCQKNDYLNKSLLEFSSSTATELSLSRTRVVDVEVDVVAIVVARSCDRSLLAVPAWLRSICHVIHFQPGKQHNQQSWL